MRCSLAPALVSAASIANAVPAAVRMILRIAGHRTYRQRCSPRAFPALGGCGGGMCKRDSESQSAGPPKFDERQNPAISIGTASDIIAAVLSAPGRRNPGTRKVEARELSRDLGEALDIYRLLLADDRKPTTENVLKSLSSLVAPVRDLQKAFERATDPAQHLLYLVP